jgi:hypothetical protein
MPDMADEQIAGTAPVSGEAQTEQGGSPAPAGTPAPVDEVTTLRSRNAGLDAKVTTLMQQIADERKAREAAEAKANEYISGKANEDQDTRALLQRLNAELEAAKRAAGAATLATKYPEAYTLLGEAIAGMTEDTLAATEARLRGVPVESHTPPVPVGNAPSRTPSAAPKNIEDMSLTELKEYSKTAFNGLTWDAISQSG